VLCLDSLRAAAEPRLGAPVFEPIEHVFHGRALMDAGVRRVAAEA
jgi:hypothetical protein